MTRFLNKRQQLIKVTQFTTLALTATRDMKHKRQQLIKVTQFTTLALTATRDMKIKYWFRIKLHLYVSAYICYN